jgi:predicted transcriptional regulator
MKPVIRTTVILDEDLRRKLKMLSLRKDMTMREIITQALEEKIKRELGSSNEAGDELDENKLVSAIIKEIEPFIGFAPARALVAQKCMKYGIQHKDLGISDISPDFIESLCSGVKLVSNAESASELRKRLIFVTRKK